MTTPMKILKMHGIRPLKRLGQSFLQDQNILRKIVAAADLRSDETVVEIGAGLGIMTGILAEQVRRVIALEIDPVMVGILRSRLRDFRNIEIVETDVLRYDFASACSGLPADRIKVVGNVPYQISSPLLFRLMAFRRTVSAMILLLQKEVVDRITAAPGNREYGIPSVLVSMYCRSSRVMDVPGSCFYPEPKVASSLLKLTVRESPLTDVGDEALFRKIVQAAFARRRKTILNNFKDIHLSGYAENSLLAALRDAGIDGTRRAETLRPEEFGRLARRLVADKEKS